MLSAGPLLRQFQQSVNQVRKVRGIGAETLSRHLSSQEIEPTDETEIILVTRDRIDAAARV
jgi:hypothetical protein